MITISRRVRKIRLPPLTDEDGIMWVGKKKKV